MTFDRVQSELGVNSAHYSLMETRIELFHPIIDEVYAKNTFKAALNPVNSESVVLNDLSSISCI